MHCKLLLAPSAGPEENNFSFMYGFVRIIGQTQILTTKVFALLFSGQKLPDHISAGAAMTTTDDGLIMTYKNRIYHFKCVSSHSCFFEKDENFYLTIPRTKHFLLAVPPSLVEDC